MYKIIVNILDYLFSFTSVSDHEKAIIGFYFSILITFIYFRWRWKNWNGLNDDAKMATKAFAVFYIFFFILGILIIYFPNN